MFLEEGPERDLVFRVVRGGAEELEGQRIPAGTGIVGQVLETGEARIVNRVDRDDDWFRDLDKATGFTTRSVVAVPLKHNEAAIGVLELLNKKGGTFFREEDVALLETFTGQAVVALENARLHQAELVKERMQRELQLGFEMQRSLIPADTPSLENWEFSAWWQPAREVSGDFYDFIPLDTGSGVVMADVADKGVHAALFMALSRSIIRASVLALHDPAAGLNQANKLIALDARQGMFLTLCYALFLPDGQVTYVNAGHNPPLWYQAQHNTITELNPTGIFMGLASDIPLEQETIICQPGDFIVLYTDGVTEAMNDRQEQFGEARLEQLVCKHNTSSADQLRDHLLAELDTFTGSTPQSDDITLVIAKKQ